MSLLGSVRDVEVEVGTFGRVDVGGIAFWMRDGGGESSISSIIFSQVERRKKVNIPGISFTYGPIDDSRRCGSLTSLVV